MSKASGTLHVCSFVVSLVLSFAADAAPNSPYSLSVEPAWHGYTKPGIGSELTLRLRSDRGGQGAVILAGSAIRMKTEVFYDPTAERLLRIPLLYDPSATAVVELYGQGELQLTEKVDLQVLAPASRVIAVVAGVATRDWERVYQQREGDKVLHLQARELPFLASTYSLLSVLAIGRAELHKLEGGQRRALDNYLASCGRLLLTGADAQSLANIRANAGCRGRQIFAEWGDVVAAQSSGDNAPLPTARALRQLSGNANTDSLRALSVFVGGYLLVLLLVCRSARSPLPLLAVPPLAALLACVGWTRGEPALQAVFWAQMNSVDAVVRFAALFDVVGTSRGDYLLSFRAQAQLPVGELPSAVKTVQYRPEEDMLDLLLTTRLMSRQSFFVQGTALAPSLTLRETSQGVVVVNAGSEVSPTGTLAWQGRPYDLPSLGPGEYWRSPDQASAWGAEVQQQWLKQRALDGGSWLLVPFVPPMASGTDRHKVAVGWLLVRGRADE